MSLALYGHPFSSYTWKALIALYANDTPFEFREVSPDQPENLAFVQAAHPAGKFPVLVDEGNSGVVIIEATSIIEYLALNHPGPAPLIPASPADGAGVRMTDRVFDNYVMGNLQRVVNAYLVNCQTPIHWKSRREKQVCCAPIAGLRRISTPCRSIRMSALSPVPLRHRYSMVIGWSVFLMIARN